MLFLDYVTADHLTAVATTLIFLAVVFQAIFTYLRWRTALRSDLLLDFVPEELSAEGWRSGRLVAENARYSAVRLQGVEVRDGGKLRLEEGPPRGKPRTLVPFDCRLRGREEVKGRGEDHFEVRIGLRVADRAEGIRLEVIYFLTEEPLKLRRQSYFFDFR